MDVVYLRSYAFMFSEVKTSANVMNRPSLKMTTSSGSFRSLLLMKRRRCFAFMHAEW
jgi:hypothetical protein